MHERRTTRKDAREQLRAYVRTTLFRTPLPGTDAPELMLPQRPGYQSHIPSHSFDHATVVALSARLPEQERSIFLDLAPCSVAEAARRRGCSASRVRKRHERRRMGLDPRYYACNYNDLRSMQEMTMGEPWTDLGRFSEPALAILTCLVDGPKHGYAMLAESRVMGVELALGTLYGALNRLERLGLIEPLPPEDRRRPYRLTPTGAVFHRRWVERLDQIVRIGQAKLSATP